MKSSLLQNDNDIQAMSALRERLAGRSTIVDFEEQIQLTSVRTTTRIWQENARVVGFAFLDDYNNLWFETDPEFAMLAELENQIIEWGTACLRKRNASTGEENTLDCVCNAADTHRLNVLKQHGFALEQVRSLQYSLALSQPIAKYPLPEGFSIRCVRGEDEVEQLVALHRAACGTDHMTVDYRLAMMNTPQYASELDLVAVTPTGELAAFCVCGFDDTEKTIGYTDPIGTHPAYQRMGLGRAIVSAGLMALKKAGANTARLGTSSENPTMQKLANQLGFICVSEKLWLSKTIV